MSQATAADVTAIITTYGRPAKLIETIARLLACDPVPYEVLVHVDNDDQQTLDALKVRFPGLRILMSECRVGPGGGRHKLLQSVRTRYAASFDDDSYPLDNDYFARLIGAFQEIPTAAVVAACIFDRNNPVRAAPGATRRRWISDFVGCGCAYDVEKYRQLAGYVPAVVPYGIEETDLALQVLDRGWGILESPDLRVYHDTDFAHRRSAIVVADTMANRLAQAYIRYPPAAWTWGVLQYLNSVRWFLQEGRVDGVVFSLVRVPVLVFRFANYRQPVSPIAIARYRRLREDRPLIEN